jgi:hypothetical protein
MSNHQRPSQLKREKPKTGLRINKIDAARRQLETAIELFLEDKDIVSIHALASGARGILLDIARTRALPEGFLQFVKPEYRKEVDAVLKEPQNFFKHGGRDPNEEFIYPPQICLFFLFEAAEIFLSIVGGNLPPKIQAMRAYFAWSHPEMLAKDEARIAFQYLTSNTAVDPIAKADWLEVLHRFEEKGA